jgi:hypothetical protein
MLDGRDRSARDADGSAEVGGADVAESGGDVAAATVAAGAEECNAGIGFGGMEGDGNFASAMDADAGNGGAAP